MIFKALRPLQGARDSSCVFCSTIKLLNRVCADEEEPNTVCPVPENNAKSQFHPGVGKGEERRQSIEQQDGNLGSAYILAQIKPFTSDWIYSDLAIRGHFDDARWPQTTPR